MAADNKKQVLLIGYGCAGRIHEKLWRKKGYRLFYVDKDWDRIKRKKNAYRNLASFFSSQPAVDCLYDICCDTNEHLNVLKSIGREIKNAKVVIEKPVVESRSAVAEFKRLIKNNPRCRIFVNENYFFSRTLRVVKEKIAQYQIRPTNIYIEFSKDRRAAIVQNRFVDRRLGVFGIEFPHMLAILNFLGYDRHLEVLHVKHQRVAGRAPNNRAIHEGSVRLIDRQTGAKAQLYSSLLGHFRYQTMVPIDNFCLKRYRVIAINSNTYRILVLLDPLNHRRRLWNKIVVSRGNKVIEARYLYDNTLLNSLTMAENFFHGRLPVGAQSLDKCCRIVEVLDDFLHYGKSKPTCPRVSL